jgi:hypothetical protein
MVNECDVLISKFYRPVDTMYHLKLDVSPTYLNRILEFSYEMLYKLVHSLANCQDG